jgi:hypothetical protein
MERIGVLAQERSHLPVARLGNVMKQARRDNPSTLCHESNGNTSDIRKQ